MYPKNLHDVDTYAGLVARIEALEPSAARLWGKMNVAQMLAHCAEVLEVMNGKPLLSTPFYMKLIGPLIKKVVLRIGPYSKDSPTHPQYIRAEPEDFARQKAHLLSVLAKMKTTGASGIRHPIFGRMTGEDVGWAAWKHLDHHLQQFGG